MYVLCRRALCAGQISHPFWGKNYLHLFQQQWRAAWEAEMGHPSMTRPELQRNFEALKRKLILIVLRWPYLIASNSSPLRGLELRVSFKDCFVRTLPTDTFPPAASVTFLDSRIQDIESSAFPQTQIGTISFIRTSLDRIHGQAFPEGSLVQKLVFDGCQLTSFSQVMDVPDVSMQFCILL